jgi:hypothetical protein
MLLFNKIFEQNYPRKLLYVEIIIPQEGKSNLKDPMGYDLFKQTHTTTHFQFYTKQKDHNSMLLAGNVAVV